MTHGSTDAAPQVDRLSFIFFNFVRQREVAQTHINGREILEIFERLRTPCHKKQLINENEVEKISSPVNGLKRPYIVCRSKAS